MKWYDDNANNGDVVISSRIRLARNLTNYPFSPKISEEQANNLLNEVSGTIPVLEDRLSKNISSYTLSKVKDTDKTAMVERHVLSPGICQKGQCAGCLLSEDEKISIMVNEEDHLRIQTITNGMNIDEAYDLANEVDDILSENLAYAFQIGRAHV